MTPDLENLEARADSDRRKHEDELLALLLLLLHQSANRADSALNLGADPFAAAADPLTGNTALRIRPAWPGIARRLYAADLVGFERTVRVIRSGTIEAETDPYVPAADYNSIARQAAARLVQHAHTAIAGGIRKSFVEAKPVRRAVGEAFGAAGLVESATSKAWLARTTAETLVGFAYEGGYVNGWYRSDVRDVLTGFAYSSVLDANTTTICFPGSVRVFPVGRLIRVFRRFYEGEMLVIRTAAAKKLEVTPNHPILTARGWLSANELKPREDVIYSVGQSGLCVSCSENVGMPPTFAELADAAFHPAVAQVEIKRASAADFHGDGKCGDSQVDIASVYGNLVCDGVSGPGQRIGDYPFSFADAGVGIRGSRFSGRAQHLRSGLLSCVASQNASCLTEGLEDPAFATSEVSLDFRRATTVGVHSRGFHHVAHGFGRSGTSRDVWQNSQLAELARDGAGSDLHLPCQRCGRFSVTVTADKLIEVSRKFVVCHVYNLESSHGCYIAYGVLVNNCRAYDGVQLPIDDVWWRYHWPKNHWGCRAVVVPRFGKFKPTENPPWQPQPMGGFGVMPAVAAGIRVQPAAA